MKFLLCCTLVPEKYEIENKAISNAANRFLTNLTNQMKKKHSLKILSYIGVSFDEEAREELQSQKDDNIRYYFKSKGVLAGVFQMLCAIWKEMDAFDYAITYNVVYAWMLTPIIAKIKRKKSVLILADYSPVEAFVGKKQQLYARIQCFFIGRYDYVIGLSENTKRYLNSKQKFLCMEGGIAKEFYDYFSSYKKINHEKVILMYSGILEDVTGIKMFVEAFINCKMDSIQLYITGDGSLSEWIIEQSKIDARISYYGCIPYDEYMEKLLEADILVNPRDMNLPENMNNFPSKIMEYLATGKTVISTRFPGWERYQDCVLFCESNVQGLKDSIEESITKTKIWRKENYLTTREFASRFIWENQCAKIIKLLRL